MGGRDGSELADLARLGVTVHRGDAGRRVPRPLRLGLRRRRSVRARATSTAGPTTCARFVDAAHALGPRRHPRRRLQPPRPGRQLPARSSPPTYFTDRYKNEWGEAHQLRRPRRRPGARVLHRQRRATGSTSSTSTACGSTPRSRSSTRRAEHILAAIGRAVRAAARRARRDHRRRERAAGCAAGAPPRARAATALDALWNDDFHHRAMVAADRAARGVLQRLPRLAAGVHLGGEVRLPLSGAALRVAEEAPRHAGARSAARGASSPSSRTTIRSPTRPAGERLHQLTSPGR